MSNTKGPSVYTCEAVVIAFVCLVAGAAIVGTFWSDSLKSAKRDADEARMERIEKALERLEKKAVSDTRNISFQWRTLSVSGVYYIGDQEDGYCETFEVEDITLGEKPLPGFLYDACISGDARTSLDEAAFEQGRNGE